MPAAHGTLALNTVYVHLTRACNLRCTYCYLSAGTPLPDEMTRDELAHVWNHLVALGPRKLVLTGGEPLLRPDLFELLADLRAVDPEHRVLRCLNTNGHLVHPELARRLVDLVDEVRVSVDALEERNDALRGPGSFEAAMNALDCLHGVGFEPKALVTVNAYTLPDLEDLVCLLHQRGITQVSLNRLRRIGRGRRFPPTHVDPTEVQSLVRRAWKRVHPDQPPPPTHRPSTSATCGVGRFLNIMPNGDVFPCHALTESQFRCGSLREESLLTICRRDRLLGRLASVDLEDLRRLDDSFPVAARDACLCDVYNLTKSSTAWTGILRPTKLAVRSEQ